MKDMVTDPGCWVPIVGTLLFLIALLMVFGPLYALLTYFDGPKVDRVLQSTPAELWHDKLREQPVLDTSTGKTVPEAAAWAEGLVRQYGDKANASTVNGIVMDMAELRVAGQSFGKYPVFPRDRIELKVWWVGDDELIHVRQFRFDRATGTMVQVELEE